MTLQSLTELLSANFNYCQIKKKYTFNNMHKIKSDLYCSSVQMRESVCV